MAMRNHVTIGEEWVGLSSAIGNMKRVR